MFIEYVYKNKKDLRCRSFFYGADGGTRTRMSYARYPLKIVCMPVSPHPHIVLRLSYYSFCQHKSQGIF